MGKATASILMLGQLLGGCAYGEMRQVLRAEVASDANCPDLQVTKVPAYAEGYQDNQYHVVGCGIDRTYTCNDEGGLVKFGSADCKFADNKVARPAVAPAPAAAPMPMDGGDDGDFGDEPAGGDEGVQEDENGAG